MVRPRFAYRLQARNPRRADRKVYYRFDSKEQRDDFIRGRASWFACTAKSVPAQTDVQTFSPNDWKR